VVIGFERRRCGAEQCRRIFHFCPHDGDVAAVVTRRVFLFVTVLLLLIHNDEADIFKRREDRRTSPDDDAHFAIADAPPFAGTLHVAER
jgi:hypothetical protein